MVGSEVTRCICHGKTFQQVRDFADEHNLCSIDELQQHDFCSNGCGLCIPYIKLVLKTGQLSFAPDEPFRSN